MSGKIIALSSTVCDIYFEEELPFIYEALVLEDEDNKLYFETQKQIDEHTVVDAKIFKYLSDKAKLSLEADNIFDSDKGDEGNFRTGRTFTVKMDVYF